MTEREVQILLHHGRIRRQNELIDFARATRGVKARHLVHVPLIKRHNPEREKLTAEQDRLVEEATLKALERRGMKARG